MMKKIIERFAAAALVIVILINIVILTNIWRIMNTDSIVRENKVSYILPDGFTPAKTKISWDESPLIPSGWVVRYTSKGCRYCTLDSEWERLVSQLERFNYRTILLLPTEVDQFDDDQILPESAKQMAFVKMDWIKQFRFTGTPTTVIFDNNGRVLWQHFGMLKEADYESAGKAIVKHTKT
jgi:hypothetical protein